MKKQYFSPATNLIGFASEAILVTTSKYPYDPTKTVDASSDGGSGQWSEEKEQTSFGYWDDIPE